MAPRVCGSSTSHLRPTRANPAGGRQLPSNPEFGPLTSVGAHPHVPVVSGAAAVAADDVDGAGRVDHGRVVRSASPFRLDCAARPGDTCGQRAPTRPVGANRKHERAAGDAPARPGFSYRRLPAVRWEGPHSRAAHAHTVRSPTLCTRAHTDRLRETHTRINAHTHTRPNGATSTHPLPRGTHVLASAAACMMSCGGGRAAREMFRNACVGGSACAGGRERVRRCTSLGQVMRCFVPERAERVRKRERV